MKKRQLIYLLLVWLFSQQVIAAGGARPEATMACDTHSQFEYRHASIEGGSYATVAAVHDSSQSAHHLSPFCDHCCTFCQPGLLSTSLLPAANTALMRFDSHVIDALIDTSFDTLFRPPIFA